MLQPLRDVFKTDFFFDRKIEFDCWTTYEKRRFVSSDLCFFRFISEKCCATSCWKSPLDVIVVGEPLSYIPSTVVLHATWL